MAIILPGNVASALPTGYNVANSLRFNDGDTASLSKTPSSNGSNTVWTVSMWCKRSHITTDQKIHAAGTSATYELLFSDADQLTLYNGSTTVFVTNRLFRDVSAWLHVVVSYNTGASGTDKCKLFINGTLETSFATDNRSSAGAMNHINQNVAQFVGNNNAGNGFDGYLAEVCVIDGTALVATSFGEFDENSPTIWKPIDVSELTFGTNGFYLDFEDSSALGNDAAGSNNFSLNNLAATDQSTDTCTNNYATLNPLHFNATIPSANTLSEGNLVFTSSQGGSAYPAMYSTMAVSQGKWYAEFKVTTGNSAIVGIGAGSLRGGFFGGGYYDYAYYYDGTFYNNGGNTGSQSSYTDGDIISVAMDLDNNKVYVAKNNTWQHSGNPSSGSGGYTITAPASQTDATGTGVYHFAYGDAGGGTPAIQGNFGSPPYSISSGNSDGNGYGNFEYAVPSGYYALNTKNLAEFG